MIILRQKEFNLSFEENSKQYETPKNLNELPNIIQKYYKVGLNKDFLELAKLQNALSEGIQLGPIPCVDLIEKDEFRSIFSDDQDSLDLGRVHIWYNPSNKKLYKKTRLFFSKFVEISDKEVKEYLKESVVEDYESTDNNKISSLEKSIIKKIESL